MKITSFIAFVCCFCLLAVACNQTSEQPLSVATNEPTNLNAIQTILPHAPGYEAFQTNCISCHSARYIQMQPELPEKTWTAIVTKMQKSFGAPLTDSSAKEIVQYLVAIKGKK
jgi:cytochrome c5